MNYKKYNQSETGASKSVTITCWPRAEKDRLSSPTLALSNVASAVRTAIVGLGIGLAASNASAITLRVDNGSDNDSGCTLRKAIVSVNNGVLETACNSAPALIGGSIGIDDTIYLNTYYSENFNLSAGQLPITKSVAIRPYSSSNYYDAYSATIDAQNNSRLFKVSGTSTTLTLTSLTLQNGSVEGKGGAIHIDSSSSVSISNSQISQSIAVDGLIVAGPGSGGAIYVANSAKLTTDNSTFSSNNAAGNGGAIYAKSGSSVTLTNTTITNNLAGTSVVETGQGGGIWSNGAQLTLNNSTVSGNSAFNQGTGIYTAGTGVSLNQSTITGNSSSALGRAAVSIYSASLTINNSILANTVNGADCAASGASIILDVDVTSIIEDASCSATVSGDPLLGPLDNNSGPTQTHVLLAGSKAIDSGVAACGFTKDQRGVLRDSICDVGAVEFASQSTVVTTEMDTPTAEDCSLRSALSSDKFGCTITNNTSDTIDRGSHISITFDPELAGKTISLVSGQLDVLTDASISAASISGITIDGQRNSRVIAIQGSSYRDRISVDIDSLTITGGEAAGAYSYGAGLFAKFADLLSISNSVITNNSLSYYGGGIYSDATTSISNSTISNNQSVGDGGGIYISSGSMGLTLTNTTVSNNLAGSNEYHEGGGIWSDGGDISLVNSTVSGNSVFYSGGGIFNSGGTTTVANSTVSDNTAGRYSGGVFAPYLRLSNSILANSTVTLGGTQDCANNDSIAPKLKTRNIVNSDSSRNTARVRKLKNKARNRGTSTNIVVSNGALTIPLISDSASIIEDGSCNALIVGARAGDPGLDPLSNNGGPTRTHALINNSIALNSGDNQNCPSTDQRGELRSDGRCDVGSFEREETNFFVIPLGNGKAAVIPL